MWELDPPRELARLVGRRRAVGSLSFSPDSRQLASGGERTVWIWDIDTGREVARLTGHQAQVTSLAFSPNARQIVSGSADRTVRVWHVETARLLAMYPTVYAVARVSWSAVGRVVRAVDLGGGTNRPHLYELELVASGDESEGGAT